MQPFGQSPKRRHAQIRSPSSPLRRPPERRAHRTGFRSTARLGNCGQAAPTRRCFRRFCSVYCWCSPESGLRRAFLHGNGVGRFGPPPNGWRRDDASARRAGPKRREKAIAGGSGEQSVGKRTDERRSRARRTDLTQSASALIGGFPSQFGSNERLLTGKNVMLCLCDGSRRRRHAHPAKARWYAVWRSLRFARRFNARACLARIDLRTFATGFAD